MAPAFRCSTGGSRQRQGGAAWRTVSLPLDTGRSAPSATFWERHRPTAPTLGVPAATCREGHCACRGCRRARKGAWGDVREVASPAGRSLPARSRAHTSPAMCSHHPLYQARTTCT